MDTKTLPVRLDMELYRRLKETAELQGSTMVDLVRRSLETFLPALAAAEAEVMEARLRRLQALAEAGPDYLDRSLQEAALAEASHADPLEEELVIVRAGEADEGEVTARDVTPE
jgi:predicted DNA-binding protein